MIIHARMIDWHRIYLSIGGILVGAISWFQEQFNFFLMMEVPWWADLGWLGKLVGIVASIAVIWMNVESALTKRAERRKIRRGKQ